MNRLEGGPRYRMFKLTGLLSFALMYNFTYMARFNISNSMDGILKDISISDGAVTFINASIFASYALGSFINGYMADKYGGRRVIIIGGLVSACLNLIVQLASGWAVLVVINILNGYFQSMIWVGGISMLVQWWSPGERGISVGIANFFSGLSHVTAYVVPVLIIAAFPAGSWRNNFAEPMIIFILLILLFAVCSKERPESIGRKPYKLTGERRRREEALKISAETGALPFAVFFRDKVFIVWCIIAMISSICRYGLLNWIIVYFQKTVGNPYIGDAFLTFTLPFGMAAGTLIITWVVCAKFPDNKDLAVTGLAALCASLIITFPMLGDSNAVIIGIFFTGFILYGINGIFWIYAMDFGGRIYAGTAAGIINGFAYIGATIEGGLFSFIADKTGDYLFIFIAMEFLCIAMAVLGLVICKKNIIVLKDDEYR